MAEIITDLDTTLTSSSGDEYYVQVAAERLGNTVWEVAGGSCHRRYAGRAAHEHGNDATDP
jgi:hypothetical protein